MGLEFRTPDSPGQDPQVLTVRLTRPGADGELQETTWLMAAKGGHTAQAFWQFAYPWEAAPGEWTMRVQHGEQQLAEASFQVVPSPVPAASPPQEPTTPPAKERPQGGGKKGEKAPGKLGDQKTAQAAPSPAEQKPASAGQEAKQPATPSAQPTPGKPAKANGQEAARGRVTGLPPDRRVYLLVAGTFSEQARAMWMAALLGEQGVNACVRPFDKGGRRLWQLVAGWRQSQEEATAARAELSPRTGEMLIVPLAAGELDKTLQCR